MEMVGSDVKCLLQHDVSNFIRAWSFLGYELVDGTLYLFQCDDGVAGDRCRVGYLVYVRGL